MRDRDYTYVVMTFGKIVRKYVTNIECRNGGKMFTSFCKLSDLEPRVSYYWQFYDSTFVEGDT